MLISTQTDVILRYLTPENGIHILKAAGYDAIDLSMFSMDDDNNVLNGAGCDKYVSELIKSAENEGIIFNQAHAPFPSMIFGNDEYNKKMPDRVRHSIEIASAVGAKAIVVHPMALPEGRSAEEQKEYNMEYYGTLVPLCKAGHIKVAVENMWGYDRRRGYIVSNVCSYGKELADYYDTLEKEYPGCFTVCLDISHSGLIGENADDAIRALGPDRLTCLHVSDNDYRGDDHTIPHLGKINWYAVTSALGEIGYRGDFTFEADSYPAHFPTDMLLDAEIFMVKVAKRLVSLIDAARK